MSPFQIASLTREHWRAVRTRYEEGIATGHATFETIAPPWEEWDGGHLAFARIVAVEDDLVFGFAALSPVSKRAAYRGVAEVSVYVAKAHRRQGIGRRLLEELIRSAEAGGVWMLQAAIFPENLPTLGLHEAAGFRVVGRRERIGRLHGAWRDTLLLERRSTRVGVE
jgi:phosphinothricin acetyltransferase